MEPDEARPPRQGASPIDWTPERREMFFDHLAVSGNITRSAAAIGVTPGAVHMLRRRDAAFADAWEEAIEAGYATIEMRLIGHALAGSGRCDAIETAGEGAEPIDVEQALRLLKERDNRRTGARGRGGSKMQRVSSAETDAALLAKLAILATRRAKG